MEGLATENTEAWKKNKFSRSITVQLWEDTEGIRYAHEALSLLYFISSLKRLFFVLRGWVLQLNTLTYLFFFRDFVANTFNFIIVVEEYFL